MDGLDCSCEADTFSLLHCVEINKSGYEFCFCIREDLKFLVGNTGKKSFAPIWVLSETTVLQKGKGLDGRWLCFGLALDLIWS